MNKLKLGRMIEYLRVSDKSERERLALDLGFDWAYFIYLHIFFLILIIINKIQLETRAPGNQLRSPYNLSIN